MPHRVILLCPGDIHQKRELCPVAPGDLHALLAGAPLQRQQQQHLPVLILPLLSPAAVHGLVEGAQVLGRLDLELIVVSVTEFKLRREKRYVCG